MPIKGGLVQDKTVAGAVTLLIAGPLLTNSGGGSCLVNLVSRTGQAPAGLVSSLPLSSGASSGPTTGGRSIAVATGSNHGDNRQQISNLKEALNDRDHPGIPVCYRTVGGGDGLAGTQGASPSRVRRRGPTRRMSRY